MKVCSSRNSASYAGWKCGDEHCCAHTLLSVIPLTQEESFVFSQNLASQTYSVVGCNCSLALRVVFCYDFIKRYNCVSSKNFNLKSLVCMVASPVNIFFIL